MADSLSETIFGKHIRQLELLDIESFFQVERKESDILEFKSYGVNDRKSDRDKLNDIIKTICAFLNSEGGIVIWGAPQGQKLRDDDEKTFTGLLSPVKYKWETDKFTNILAAEISPLPLGILFHSIKADDNSYCYIIEVSKSIYSPHQYKGTYFMRLDGSTRIAPHHYVEALMKKISFPRLEGHILFGNVRYSVEQIIVPFTLILSNLSTFVHEKDPEYKLMTSNCSFKSLDAVNELDFPQTDRTKHVKNVLHQRMPYCEDFLLYAKRVRVREPLQQITLMLTFWGELSPVLLSKYDLQIFGTQTGTTCEVIKREENIYLYKANELRGINEQESKEKSHQLLVEQLNNRTNDLYFG